MKFTKEQADKAIMDGIKNVSQNYYHGPVAVKIEPEEVEMFRKTGKLSIDLCPEVLEITHIKGEVFSYNFYKVTNPAAAGLNTNHMKRVSCKPTYNSVLAATKKHFGL